MKTIGQRSWWIRLSKNGKAMSVVSDEREATGDIIRVIAAGDCPECSKWEQQCHDTAMECDKLEQFARLVEPYVADRWCHNKTDLGQRLYNACVDIRPLIYRRGRFDAAMKEKK